MSRKGFSLIELLVAVTILAILAAVGIAAFRGTATNARDAKRKADIDAIAKALEAKYDAERGVYPTDLETRFFATKSIPQKPEGGDYDISWTDSAHSGFQICAPLDTASGTSCSGPSATCYCKRSSQGKFIAAASPSGAGGDGVASTSSPSPAASPTFTPFVPATGMNAAAEQSARSRENQMTATCLSSSSLTFDWSNVGGGMGLGGGFDVNYSIRIEDITSGSTVLYRQADVGTNILTHTTSGIPGGSFRWRIFGTYAENAGGYTIGTPIYSYGQANTGFYGPDVSCPGVYPTPAPTPSAKRVFVTSTTYNGNLGGLSGADAKCQARADAANLGGVWKAWLSDGSTSASSRLTHWAGGYKKLDNVVIASSWDDLIDGSLQSPINVTELSDKKVCSINVCWNVWTGTNEFGNSAVGLSSNDDKCRNWTYSLSDALSGSTGLNTTTTINDTWTDGVSRWCYNSSSLYCFEQ